MKQKLYIGWKDRFFNGNRKILTLFLVPLFLLLPLLSFLIVYFQKPFNNHQFESETQREFEGIYFDRPQPMLLLDDYYQPDGLDPQALLVGYGKFGARSTIKEIEKKWGSFNGKKIRLQGTLLFGDEKILIELTQGTSSVLSVQTDLTYALQQTSPKLQQLKGEIIDPKCWFGAMKPGEGKVHKSCAIRCISGGIPPMLKVHKNNGNIYYLLENTAPKPINAEILDFVGEPVEITGSVYYQNGWNVLQTNANKIMFVD